MERNIHLTEKESLHYLGVNDLTSDFKQDLNNHPTQHVIIQAHILRKFVANTCGFIAPSF